MINKNFWKEHCVIYKIIINTKLNRKAQNAFAKMKIMVCVKNQEECAIGDVIKSR